MRAFCTEMANNFHMTEEVKSFHTTQTQPFIVTQKMGCEEQNTFKKSTMRTDRKDLFYNTAVFLVISNAAHLEMLGGNGEIAGWDVKGKSRSWCLAELEFCIWWERLNVLTYHLLLNQLGVSRCCPLPQIFAHSLCFYLYYECERQ